MREVLKFCCFPLVGVLILLAASSAAFAEKKSKWYTLFPLYSQGQIPEGFEFLGSLGGKILVGNNHSVDKTTAPTRSMMVYGAELVAAERFRYFFAGGAFDYSLWKQWNHPNDVGGINTQGKAQSFGPVAGFALGPVNLIGKYFFYSKFNLDKPNAAGQSVSYSSPTSFEVELQLRNSKYTYWGAQYLRSQYKQSTVGAATATELWYSARMNYSAFGLVFGMGYFGEGY
jgi:hypothetical protein